jgi:peptidoglycan/LPS O-acetylase OafA/YrhL
MTQGPHKLDQLTSLRFIAAFMIVLHHADGLFGIGPSGVNLGQRWPAKAVWTWCNWSPCRDGRR